MHGDRFGTAAPRPRTGSARARGARAGMSLLELMIAIVLLLIGMLGFTQSLVSSVTTGATTRETSLATEAARRTLETLSSEDFGQVFARYNADPTDDPGGAGSAPGASFAVAGLQAAAGDPDGLPGEILFPTLAGAPGVLREDAVNAALGVPRDLDGDGVVDALDHASDYRLLPVVVRVSWRGKAGDAQFELRTLLADL